MEPGLDELHAELCKVFTSPTRIRILGLLRHGERSVGDLARALGLPQPNVSQHLALMRIKGVLASRREGVAVYYRVANPKVLRAFDLIQEALRERLRVEGRMTGGFR